MKKYFLNKSIVEGRKIKEMNHKLADKDIYPYHDPLALIEDIRNQFYKYSKIDVVDRLHYKIIGDEFFVKEIHSKAVFANFDRFDVLEAYYIYFVNYHSGQNSIGYKRLCKILKYFTPRPTLSEKTLSDNGYIIYKNLVDQNKDA